MSKGTTILVWIAIGLGALAYLGAGSAKLLGVPQMAESFTHFGLPLWFMTFIGAAEVTGAVGLYIRRLAAWAALGLASIIPNLLVVEAWFRRRRAPALA